MSCSKCYINRVCCGTCFALVGDVDVGGCESVVRVRDETICHRVADKKDVLL